jgi:hypothetical protein
VTPNQLIILCHERVHDAEHDPQDTVFASMTRRDCWTLCLALIVLGESLPCVAFATDDLRLRVAELIDVQKDDWKSGPSS